MKMHRYAGLALLFASCHSLAQVPAQVPAQVSAQVPAQVPAERAVKYRQSAYYLMGQHLSRMNLVLKGEMPYDKGAVDMNAEVIELMSRIVFDAFPPGSEGPSSKAKPEIWREMDKFKQLARATQGEVEKLRAAAKTGDLALLRARFNDVSKSCKVCHDQFKTK